MGSRSTGRVTRLPTCSNTKVIDEQVPILVQSPSEDCEDQLLEVLWAVRRSKRETSRQPTAASRQDCHLLLRLFLVIDLIETLLEITNGDELVTRY